MNVSYIGTAFRGVTSIEPFYRYRDLRTVQGVIENAVKFVSTIFNKCLFAFEILA